MIFGYARVSTKEQNLSLQQDALKEYGCDEIVEEISSGAKVRPQLYALLEKLRAGDVLVVWKLDRLGRTARELIFLAEDLSKKRVSLVSLQEQLDTQTPTGKFVFTLFAAFAEMERNVLVERTKAGLSSARSRGRCGGRRPVDEKKIAHAMTLYESNQYKGKEIAEITGISRATLYNYLKKRKEKKDG